MSALERVGLARVMRAAAVLANRHGLDRLSMSELAKSLGVRTPSLYSHVEGMDAVKRLLALQGLAELDSAVARASVGLSGPKAVRAVLVAYRDYAEKNPGVYAATIPTPPRSDKDWSEAVDQLMATFITAIQGYGLRGPFIVHALRGLRSLVHGFVSLEAEGALKHPVDRDESFEWLASSFVGALDKLAAPTTEGDTHDSGGKASRTVARPRDGDRARSL